MMQVKIFQGWGHSGVVRMETEINEWLMAKTPLVIRTDTASCATGEAPDEVGQTVTITVWYNAG